MNDTQFEDFGVALLQNEQKENQKALEKGEPSALVMEQINKREAVTARQRREQYAIDGFEAEHQQMKHREKFSFESVFNLCFICG